MTQDGLLEDFMLRSFDRVATRLDRSFRGGASAEDAVQEALVRAWQRSAAGEPVTSWDGWIATVSANLARSEWRRRQAEARALSRYMRLDRSGVTDWPPELEHLGPVAEAVEGLPLRESQVIVLRYYGDLDLRRIAELLGVSEGTVKRCLHDARNRLRQRLGEYRRQPLTRRTTMHGWFMAGSHPAQYGHEFVPDAYEGGRVVRFWCTAGKPDGFGTLMQSFLADRFRGRRVRFSIAVRASGVDDWAGAWMRVDGPGRSSLAFDNMQDRSIKGTVAWSRYDVVLDVAEEATAIALGVLMSGRGEAWLAAARFEQVGPEVPVTGGSGSRTMPEGPVNLDFAEDEPAA
jgi:RNA polymerase sigma factor (sigma-70 family)